MFNVGPILLSKYANLCMLAPAGHILSRVYNCRSHLLKSSDDLFTTNLPEFSSVPKRVFLTNTKQILKVQLHTKISYDLFSSFPRNFLRFSPLFLTLTLTNLQLQLRNSPFTTANYILQLQKL